jgi:hypothetical protein
MSSSDVNLPWSSNDRTILDLLGFYERFASRAEQIPALEVYSTEIEPTPPGKIDAYAKQQGVRIPPDVRAFWQSGLTNVEISRQSGNEMLYGAGTDFCQWSHIVRDTPMLRQLGQQYHADNPFMSEIRRLHQYGVPLSYSEPLFLLDGDPSSRQPAVHRMLYDGNPELSPIAPNFTEFFEHWLAAGCFTYGDFDAYWNDVGQIVSQEIPHADNLWLRFYDRQYKTHYAM